MKSRVLLLSLALAAHALASHALANDAAADTGGWYRHVAISPDARQVAFVSHGDIYTASLLDGAAVNLTRSEEWNAHPVWSRDGRRLAFSTDRSGNLDVFIMQADGSDARQLTWHCADDIPVDFLPGDMAVAFVSERMGSGASFHYPKGRGMFGELYGVAIEGGTPHRLLSGPLAAARIAQTGGDILFEDVKSTESEWRKGESSPSTRDIWLYRARSGAYHRLTQHPGADRNPVWAGAASYYFLSDEDGPLNVWRGEVASGKAEKITHFAHHPVRSLSIADDGTLAFENGGDIFIKHPRDAVRPLRPAMKVPAATEPQVVASVKSGITEFAIAPSADELAFIAHGDVFVARMDGSAVKRVTTTAAAERSVSYAADGRRLLYSAERDGYWSIVESSVQDAGERSFLAAARIEDRVLVSGAGDRMYPQYSPDQSAIAYWTQEEALVVLDRQSGHEATVVPGESVYSAAEGDLHFDWSADSRWLVVQFGPRGRTGMPNVGIVPADGSHPIVDITQSGYSSKEPLWHDRTGTVLWKSNRYGKRPHGSWAENDSGFDLFAVDLNPPDRASRRSGADGLKMLGALGYNAAASKVRRLTPTSSDIPTGAFAMSTSGSHLYFLSRSMGDRLDLWQLRIGDGELARLTSIEAKEVRLSVAPDDSRLVLLADNRLKWLDLRTADLSAKTFRDITIDRIARYSRHELYLATYDHVVNTVRRRIYKPELLDSRWRAVAAHYRGKVTQVSHDRDLAQILAEMLGELNVSHTGAALVRKPEPQALTAALGMLLDDRYRGEGVRILEVLPGGPLARAGLAGGSGMTIVELDGERLGARSNIHQRLAGKAGQTVRLALRDAQGRGSQLEVEPVTWEQQLDLLYERWVERRRARVEERSEHRIGYVHLGQMTDATFRKLYSDVFGRYNEYDALIVDVRFNTGGALSEDFVKLFSGAPLNWGYSRQRFSLTYPYTQWTRPALMLVNAAGYSDGFLSPWTFQTVGLGKLVGSSVPGTGVGVFVESLPVVNIQYLVPQYGMVDSHGNDLEGLTLVPDIVVINHPAEVDRGLDAQLDRAIDAMMQDIAAPAQAGSPRS